MSCFKLEECTSMKMNFNSNKKAYDRVKYVFIISKLMCSQY